MDIAKKKGTASTTSSGNEDVLARLIVNKYVSLTKTHKEIKSKNVEVFIEIILGQTMGTRGQNARSDTTLSKDAKTRQEFRFYLQPHDHLCGPELEMALNTTTI
ncbi:hypothetical protein Tco_0416250 [Tanacetum coccineum]